MSITHKYTYYLLLFAFLSCQNEPNKVSNTQKTTIEQEITTPNNLLEQADFKTLLAEQKGKIVLVNLWATWCKPCVYELPALEKLHRKYKDQDVRVMALSIEGKAKADSLVQPFWEELNLTMDNYIISNDDPSVLINTFDRTWLGVVPTSYIFDQDGKKVETITGTLSYKEFESKILSYKKQTL